MISISSGANWMQRVWLIDKTTRRTGPTFVGALAELDVVDLTEEFEKRTHIMRTVPHVTRAGGHEGCSGPHFIREVSIRCCKRREVEVASHPQTSALPPRQGRSHSEAKIGGESHGSSCFGSSHFLLTLWVASPLEAVSDGLLQGMRMQISHVHPRSWGQRGRSSSGVQSHSRTRPQQSGPKTCQSRRMPPADPPKQSECQPRGSPDDRVARGTSTSDLRGLLGEDNPDVASLKTMPAEAKAWTGVAAVGERLDAC